ncbi:TetR/AcrR family transcriptional regulator [Pseudonocardia hierapolitana]|nr:TetR/AcrR family transcriptional regulator [Pseudonocardia hierapolitana]
MAAAGEGGTTVAQRERDSAGAPPVEAPDHRKGSRRRGEKLYSAIYEATLAELVDVGYADLTMKGIAQRAGASKGSLYRRWSGRAELVVDAVQHAVPVALEVPDVGSVRDDVLGFLRRIATVLNGPIGVAVRGLLVETVEDPELSAVVRARFIEPVTASMLEALRRGVVRGEVRPAALTPLVANVGPSVLREHFLLRGGPIPDALLVDIVDTVVVPLTRA